VKTLFQDLESNDSKKQALTINMIGSRLQIVKQKVFTGFTNSQNQTLQKVGNDGMAVIKKRRILPKLLPKRNEKASLNLRDGKFDDALVSFEAAEKAFSHLSQPIRDKQFA
jgi:hypothetical protein